MVPVNLSDMQKPVLPDEATSMSNLAGTRGTMVKLLGELPALKKGLRISLPPKLFTIKNQPRY